MIIIRHETPTDTDAIHIVNKLAFDSREDEPGLVNAIRKSENFIQELSLVAEKNGQILGHILFSRIHIEIENGQIPALALAPMAVLPDYQKQCIGSRLVRHGLDECKRLGYSIVIVLGHVAYYPRFGFSAASAKSLDCPFGDCGNAWMALELVPAALKGVCGSVIYPSAFNSV
jgi:putative acetyltransferase